MIMAQSLYRRLEAALLETDPQNKSNALPDLVADWNRGKLNREEALPIRSIEIPGRPEVPRLVDPRALSRRSTASEAGRINLLHAFAHIEFNAINIALDAAYRFRQMPDAFVGDWLLVASEEARHFALLNQALLDRGSSYGALDAHNGLWDMVCKTRDDVLHRMALVPRVMEARGLDVTPGMIERFEQVGDQQAVEILQVIYRDEVEHVRIGNHWYHFLCRQRGLDVTLTFHQLVDTYLQGRLRGPFNWPARLKAGFEADELTAMEDSLAP